MPTLVLCLAASALALMAVWPASSAGAAPKAPAAARLSTPPILARGGDPARRSGAQQEAEFRIDRARQGKVGQEIGARPDQRARSRP